MFYKRKANIMKLSNKAIEGISGNRAAILDLCLALGFSELWVNKLVETNKDNGPLTTVKSLQVIQEVTGLTQEQILEETGVKNTAA